jgi:8-oxo-dGTP pyrophosphatase MutT (NUDIX family)
MRQFTATVYIFHDNKVLLHKHAKLGKWLPPGGHLEKDETPPEAAIREAKEETGLDITFITQENLTVDAPNAISIPRPYLCLLEEIPAHKEQPAHQHIDFIYLAKANSTETTEEFHWLSYEETEKLDLFPDTREVLKLTIGKKIHHRGTELEEVAQRKINSPLSNLF